MVETIVRKNGKADKPIDGSRLLCAASNPQKSGRQDLTTMPSARNVAVTVGRYLSYRIAQSVRFLAACLGRNQPGICGKAHDNAAQFGFFQKPNSVKNINAMLLYRMLLRTQQARCLCHQIELPPGRIPTLRSISAWLSAMHGHGDHADSLAD